jgi:acyl-coenzyme A thioesterase PaaI-like protein
MNLLFLFPPSIIAFLLSLWPPLWFTGIRYHDISADFMQIRVKMVLRFYNKNIIGIQYGGSLFSMVDPCYMLLLMRHLGREYKILDQAAEIEFISPGNGDVNAIISLTQKDLDDIIDATREGNKYLKTFVIEILNNEYDIIAKVTRVLYIRKKMTD